MSQPIPHSDIFGEISSQGQAWGDLTSQLLAASPNLFQLFEGVDEVIFSGCGSGFNAALTARPLFQHLTSIPSQSVPSADVYLFPDSFIPKERKTLAVLISRSGKTTETVLAMEIFRQRKISSLAITCDPESPLARGTTQFLALTPVQERAITTTRSLTGMILAMQIVAGIVARNSEFLNQLQQLPEIFAARHDLFHSTGRTIGQRTDITKYAFLGSSLFFGLAHEAQLKVKEMTLLPADSYPALDFRHGPMATVNEQSLITAFISDSGKEAETQVLKDMKQLGGVVWAICEKSTPALKACADHLLELDSGLDEIARACLYLPAVQYMACYRALTEGYNPDRPTNLPYWVDTSMA